MGQILPDIYKVNVLHSRDNKELKIKTFAEASVKRFFFRSDVSYDSEYSMFMRNLSSYVYLGKNKHDDAADNVASYCKLLVNRGYIK